MVDQAIFKLELVLSGKNWTTDRLNILIMPRPINYFLTKEIAIKLQVLMMALFRGTKAVILMKV